MNRLPCALATGLLAVGTVVGEVRAASWHSVADDSELVFTAYYEGEALPGRFERFRVELETGEGAREPRALVVEVETGSADMRDREINAEIAEPEWFDIRTYPVARYESDSIRAEGDGYVASGRLRLKGVERSLEIPLELTWDDGGIGLSGSVRLSRQDWRIGTGEWSADASLSERVDLRWRVDLAPAP
jgi:polyisoprenoid-binding protein YceI